MKTTARILTATSILSGPAATAFAAGPREDTSGIFVWIFLGFCALIVVAQLLPAVLVLFGFAKAIGKEKEVAPETVLK